MIASFISTQVKAASPTFPNAEAESTEPGPYERSVIDTGIRIEAESHRARPLIIGSWRTEPGPSRDLKRSRPPPVNIRTPAAADAGCTSSAIVFCGRRRRGWVRTIPSPLSPQSLPTPFPSPPSLPPSLPSPPLHPFPLHPPPRDAKASSTRHQIRLRALSCSSCTGPLFSCYSSYAAPVVATRDLS